MGEMSVRSKPHKDLAASFNRLKRMVGDIKSARKSLAAHHSFVAELVSVSLFPAVPSSKGPSPRIPSHHLQRNDLQELGIEPMPLRSSISCSASPSTTPAKPPSQSPPFNMQLDDVGIGPALLQLDDLQEMSSLRSKISPLSAPSQGSYISPSNLSCDILQEPDHANTLPPDPSTAAHSGKLTARSTFWASLLLAFLCFFLCIGKEIAVSVTITAYFVIWRIFKRRLVAKQPTGSTSPSVCHKEDSRPLNRSSTMPTYRKGFLLSSQLSTRSKSLPTLLGCVEEEERYSKKSGFTIYSVASAASLCNTGMHCARLKLGIMFVLALCGLVHGQVMAVCVCSCCILIFSATQRLTLKSASIVDSTSSTCATVRVHDF